jgi:glutamyl-tRNA synthetase
LHLQQLLGLATPRYVHVPLVLGPDGARLSKRHGAVTLADLGARGVGPRRVLAWLGATLGLCPPDDPVDLADLLGAFELTRIPREPLPWTGDVV